MFNSEDELGLAIESALHSRNDSNGFDASYSYVFLCLATKVPASLYLEIFARLYDFRAGVRISPH
jgi:hypothetical protein